MRHGLIIQVNLTKYDETHQIWNQRRRRLLTSSASKVWCSDDDQPALRFDAANLSSKTDIRSVHFKIVLTECPETGLESRAC